MAGWAVPDGPAVQAVDLGGSVDPAALAALAAPTRLDGADSLTRSFAGSFDSRAAQGEAISRYFHQCEILPLRLMRVKRIFRELR